MTTIARPQHRVSCPDTMLTVLPHLAAGLSELEVADRLGITHHAVRARRQALMTHLGARNLAHAVDIAHRRGLLHHGHRAFAVHRALADRHASDCALLAQPVCDCLPEETREDLNRMAGEPTTS